MSKSPAENQAHPRKRLFLVDDHPVMRAGLAALIEAEEGLAVCGEAEDAAGALAAMEQSPPDLAIVDISLKESSGLDLIPKIRARWPKLPILVMSMHDELFYAERALRAGARGYLTKNEAPSKVVQAARQVLDGGIYVSQGVATRMLSGMVGGGHADDALPMERLSPRELEVIELIGQGLDAHRIAERLNLSVKTVGAHRERIKRKLNLATSAELMKYAVQWVQFGRGG